VTDEGMSATVLSEEFISMLARRHAAWAGNPNEYEARLAKADPLQIYIASLNAIRQMCEHIPHGCNEAIHHATINAIQALEAKGLWPLYVHGLDELL
jgi:hypothetical protein